MGTRNRPENGQGVDEQAPLLGSTPPRASKVEKSEGDHNPHLVDVLSSGQSVVIRPHCMKGWCSVLVVFVLLFFALLLLISLFFVRIFDRGYIFELGTLNWWILTGVCHIPYYLILFFLVLGFCERIGYFVWVDGCSPEENPTECPTGKNTPSVCVQLAMFNEHEVCERVIEAACCIDWPRDKFEVQVLDDSTDADVARRVDACAERMRSQWGINCYVRRRVNRKGYKAGALEEGRKETKAEFLVLFDADFMPTKSYLKKAIPHFYANGTRPLTDLALVQCQWGHLNPWASGLTMSQSLWIDDHHTVQMAWRSRIWSFVNFTGASCHPSCSLSLSLSLSLSSPSSPISPHFTTQNKGTAGVWRASAIEAAGGWRSASLVEDCELSFRVLFTGYRTKFVNSIVQPAELPDSVTAYKAQQKRWTQGWVQLWRMHFYHLLFVYKCSFIKRMALIYHMLIVWQWPIWTAWFFMFPFMVWFGCWFGELDGGGSETMWILFYTVPMLSWLLFMTVLASLKTKHTYPEPLGCCNFIYRTCGRLIPYMILNSGMLPHQLCSFMDGYLEDLHAEFERTPKKGDREGKNDWERKYLVPSSAGTVSHNSSGLSLPELESGNGTTATVKASLTVETPPHKGAVAAAAVPAPAQNKMHSKIHWYVYAELVFVVYQLFWIDLYIKYGEYFAAGFGIYQTFCMLALLAAYGDDRDSDLYSRLERFNRKCCSCFYPARKAAV